MNYEIRKINGQDVFVKEIGNHFWLINNVYVLAYDGYQLSDFDIIDYLDAENDDMLPYKGADKECVLHIFKTNDSSDVCEEHCYLSELSDKSMAVEARRAYDEYKSWAGV
jgi:hypothetical protein